MIQMKRYAVYYAPPPGPFADHASAWLGWDAALGQAVPHPVVPGLPIPVDALTAEPRKYGFHGTLRAPFRLADGAGEAALDQTLRHLAQALCRVELDGLKLQDLDGFLALTPDGDVSALAALAQHIVEATDTLRAPLTQDEIARRRPETLTSRQRAYLDRWGYPFVKEFFQFHLTLTGRLSRSDADTVFPVVRDHFSGVLPQPFAIEDVCLFGEDMQGRFHLMHRYALSR